MNYGRNPIHHEHKHFSRFYKLVSEVNPGSSVM